jgi:predicted GTPase
VYAHDDLSSLLKVAVWQEYIAGLLTKRPKFYLLANKSDKLTETPLVESEYACYHQSFSVSALLGKGLKKAFTSIVNDLCSESVE